ncbi:MAG TPA: hypothetical protein VMD92_05590 [Acidobacteriaceae bacterium]|nr:hypothetical protein [Acidobacteriaceae bacterium]
MNGDAIGKEIDRQRTKIASQFGIRFFPPASQFDDAAGHALLLFVLVAIPYSSGIPARRRGAGLDRLVHQTR